jgi:putative ABC transport system permease protein
MSFSVSQRTNEIGIRMALGDGAPSVLGLVIRQGMTIAWVGLGVGVVAALALMRYLTTMTMIVVSLLPCYVPARRAAREDPLVAIRTE